VNFRSIADLNDAIIRGLPKIPQDVDLVVGIPRSGLLAATIVACHRNLPLTDLEGLIDGRLLPSFKRPQQPEARGLAFAKKVLVLDDSILSGRAMALTRDRLAEARLSCQIIYAAVYAAPECRSKVDLYFEEIHGRRVFEWNLMRSKIISESCVDIDGVLCFDPSEDDNDDGPRYQRFLAEAQPLLLPTERVGWLVTSRLEKYRRLTEQWLERHGVRYGELVMLDLSDKAARVAEKPQAKFKAEAYRRTGAALFVESSPRQAAEIAEATGLPVLCTHTRQMVYPSLAAHAPSLARKVPGRVFRWIRRRVGDLRRRVLQFDPPPSR
jgi:uncharacterized HAD superfamily protein